MFLIRQVAEPCRIKDIPDRRPPKNQQQHVSVKQMIQSQSPGRSGIVNNNAVPCVHLWTYFGRLSTAFDFTKSVRVVISKEDEEVEKLHTRTRVSLVSLSEHTRVIV